LLSAILIALFFNGFVHGSEPTRTADYDYEPPAPGSYLLPVIKSAADGEVLDADGHALRLADLTRAQVTVMSFIYTRCGQTCPYATGVLNQLYRLSSHDRVLADSLRLISLSFDPSADTPAKMRAYGELAQNETRAAEWRFLTTASQDQLTPILNAYGQSVQRKQNPNDPTGPLQHNLRVFLIDRLGRVRNIYSAGTLDVRLVLADVRTLLMEQ